MDPKIRWEGKTSLQTTLKNMSPNNNSLNKSQLMQPIFKITCKRKTSEFADCNEDVTNY